MHDSGKSVTSPNDIVIDLVEGAEYEGACVMWTAGPLEARFISCIYICPLLTFKYQSCLCDSWDFAELLVIRRELELALVRVA